ncbi:MAG: hypothetical protein HN576_02990 [Bacteriovoracaceae bacterium]|jgi:hypothetical protein|nr:hypothetical protein [Bacteriovoracaceae bacterium]
MYTALAFIEFEREFEELEKFLKICDQNKNEIGVLCFDISLRKRISNLGFDCFDPTDYFHKDDHYKCLKKLDFLEGNLADLFNNELSDKKVNYHTTLFYLSFYYSHLLYFETLGKNIIKNNPSILKITSPTYRHEKLSSPRLENNESCLDTISQSLSSELKLKKELYEVRCPKVKSENDICENIFGRLANFLSLHTLKYGLKKPTVIIGASSHRCDSVVNKSLGQDSLIQVISMPGLNRIKKPEYSSFLFLLKIIKLSGLYFLGIKSSYGVCYEFDFYPFKQLAQDDRTNKFNQFFTDVRKTGIIKHDLLNLLERKTIEGINPLLGTLENVGNVLKEVFRKSKPIGFVTPHSLNGTQLLGDLSLELGIPGVLISHGSHSVPQNSEIENELKRHGLGLIHSNFDHVAIQSPLARNYLEYFNIERKNVPTGPLLWGTRFSDKEVIEKKEKFVITHAGSQKPRESLRFLFYETTDEYVKSILSLVNAVKGMDEIECIIRFRPTNSLTLETLREIIPEQRNVKISAEGPFLEVLAKTDLLVSYSSTTMEEAIENRIPVLQYSLDNRFTFLPSVTLSNEEETCFSPVYSIDPNLTLRDGLAMIVKLSKDTKNKEDYYKEYSIPANERTEIKHLIEAWCQAKE